jgi:sugar lactone lactonase YvrE
MRKTFLVCLWSSFISLGVFSAFAGGPVFWRVNTRAEVEKGDAKGVSIADNGALTLAPTLAEVFDTKQAYIWSAVADNSGNVYLGTGHEGRVFKVDPAGKGALLYKTSELDVMALAVDAQGNVYAGTSPDGKVYRISPGGEARVFFEPKTKYIWSLAFDAQGRLLVGTGDKGVIYRVNRDGTGAPFVTVTQTNITALRVDPAGNVIAGTDPGGLVLRVSPDGKVFTLFDSSLREIRDLALGPRGEIFALALAESAGSGAANTAPATSATPTVQPPLNGDEGTVTITLTDVQVIDTSSASGGSTGVTSTSGQSKSALYRLDADGASDLLWDSKEAVAFAIAVDGARQVMVGTGQKGRIYGASRGQKPMLIAQSSEAQTSRFVRGGPGGNQLFVASSNLGKLFKLDNETSATGTYTSSVRDAQTTATWGRISWIGEGAIELQTRSGNTANPDSTWSDWSAPVVNPDGDAIKSLPARFIQWRATLKKTMASATPRLREVMVSYLPRNLAPRINSINVLPIGVVLQALPQPQMDTGADAAGLEPSALGAIAQMPPRRIFQRGAVSLQWQAEDRNGDSIEYAVYYRNASGGEFYPLKKELRENYFTIDANSLPDGRYVFKVVASDDPSNPGSLALTDEQETEAIEIDNTPPAVTADAPRVTGSNVEVVFRATDATSIIRRAEYQVDGGAWKAVFPIDGIADSKREEFRVTATVAGGKPHVVALRVFDANANVGSAQAPIK